MSPGRLSSPPNSRSKKQLRVSIQIGSGSGWRAQLIRALLSVVVLAFLLLLIFGLWLAFSVSLVVIGITVLLRVLWPKRERTKIVDGEWSVMSNAASLDDESHQRSPERPPRGTSE
jgi:Flp pilus assembly protein TadB